MSSKLYIENHYICRKTGIMHLETGVAKYTLYAVAGLSAFFAPLQATLLFVGFLVIADFAMGVAKAAKNGNLSSRRMADKFYVSVGYFLGILVAHSMEGYFGDAVPMVKAVVAIIALTEIQSLRENIECLTGTDILKPIVKILRKEANEDEGN